MCIINSDVNINWELNFGKEEWLLNCFYNLKHISIESYLDSLSKNIDSLSSKYDNFILLGDFNSCMEDFPMKALYYQTKKSYKRANMF